MKKVEAIIRPERLQNVQDALDELGVSGLTVTEVMGCGRQKGYTEQYRGSRANISLLPKLKVESVVPNDVVDPAGRARRGDDQPRDADRLGVLSRGGSPTMGLWSWIREVIAYQGEHTPVP